MTSRYVQKVIALNRASKRLVVIALDLLLALITVWLAFHLRLDQIGFAEQQQIFVYVLAPVLAVPIFIRFGLYRAIFRYTGMAAMATLVKAVGIYAVLFFAKINGDQFRKNKGIRWHNGDVSAGVGALFHAAATDQSVRILGAPLGDVEGGKNELLAGQGFRRFCHGRFIFSRYGVGVFLAA